MNGGESGPTTISIRGEVWRYDGPAGWYFVSLDHAASAQIDLIGHLERVGFGYVKVVATLGETEWQTTLFPDADGFYLLAIKAAVRKIEDVEEGDTIDLTLSFPVSST